MIDDHAGVQFVTVLNLNVGTPYHTWPKIEQPFYHLFLYIKLLDEWQTV